jgi:hypothetical protein
VSKLTEEFNIEDHIEFLGSNEPKDLKGSIRNKYKRRLKSLAHILDDFIYHAELRLDKSRAGNIHKREETENLLRRCKDLREFIPITDDDELTDQISRNICEFLDIPFE